ncbi:hypothetical protein C5B91_21570, partial [Haloferax sp. Atlit-10N]
MVENGIRGSAASREGLRPAAPITAPPNTRLTPVRRRLPTAETKPTPRFNTPTNKLPEQMSSES